MSRSVKVLSIVMVLVLIAGFALCSGPKAIITINFDSAPNVMVGDVYGLKVVRVHGKSVDFGLVELDGGKCTK